jgi:hypothetical protein
VWWDASEDNLSNYNSSNSDYFHKTMYINTDSSGKGSFQFAVDENDWRYLVRVADEDGGHATAQTVLIDWPIWSGKTKYRCSTASMLVFRL